MSSYQSTMIVDSPSFQAIGHDVKKISTNGSFVVSILDGAKPDHLTSTDFMRTFHKEFRQEIPPVPDGFHRERMDFSISGDGKVEWHVLDVRI